MKPLWTRRGLLCALLAGLAAGLVLLGLGVPGRSADRAAPDKAAVERTRQTVQMLDDLNKNYVVTITDMYVKAQKSAPAARVAKKVFKQMAEKGWGTGRLVDATGAPFNEDNVAKSDFEKRAVKAIKDGEPYVDEVGQDQDGKPVLRAATVVPVVMEQCAACHAGYKKGDVLGALVYELPIK
jgi:Protein of unknown function (DUF3365)